MQGMEQDGAEPERMGQVSGEDRGEVFHEMNAMTVSLDQLEGSIERLRDNLDPVISKRSGVTEGPEVESERPEPAVCPLSGQMRGHRTRLNRLGFVLDSLRKSLEL